MKPDGAFLRRWWERLSPLPGGKRLFAWLLFLAVPYSGSTRPRINELAPGFVRLSLPDRRRVRNHLGSIHAIALTNVAELASGLSLMAALDSKTRAIVTGLEIDFLKKARGELSVEAKTTPPVVTGDMDYEVTASVSDREGNRVAECRVQWKLGPRPTR